MHFGTSEAHINAHVLRSIEAMDVSQYQDARVIVKGCGKVEIDHVARLGELEAAAGGEDAAV